MSPLRRLWVGYIVALFAALGACSEVSAPAPSSEWNRGVRCPSEWVPAASGGCGPAVVLCAPDGGAASGACGGVDVTRSRPVAGSDGGVTFRRTEAGEIAGAWHWPGEVGGPPLPSWRPDAGGGVPAATWRPDAGIPTCPAGWRRTAEGLCDPALAVCPEGAEALPGGSCTATAEADCPSTAFADPGPEATGGQVAYVLASAPDSCAPRGSRECPWRTVGEALASGRAWVLVGDGAYRENLAVMGARHLVGRCAARVRVEGAGDAPTVRAHGAATEVELRGVTVAGGLIGMVVEDGASARAGRVRVLGATRTGVRLNGPSRFDASDLVIADTRPIGEEFGHGVSANEGSRVQLSRAALVRNTTTGLFVSGAEVTVEDSSIQDTRAASARAFATGVFVRGDAVVRARRAAVEASGHSGLHAADIGGAPRVELVDVAVRGTRVPARADAPEAALRLQGAVSFDGERLLLDANLGHGLYVERAVHEDGTPGGTPRAWLRDSVVRGPAAPPDGTQQVGLFAQIGGELRATRVRVVNATRAGAVATGPGARLSLEDSVIERTREEAATEEPSLGAGLKVEQGARAEVRGAVVSESARYGVLVDAPGDGADPEQPQLVMEDSVVRGTHYDAAGRRGGGVQVQRGGRASLRRTRLVANMGRGLSAIGGRATLEDGVVEDTVPVATENPMGLSSGDAHNLAAQEDGAIVAARVLLRSGRGAVGALAAGEGAAVTLRDAVVEGPGDAGRREVACLVAERAGSLAVERVALLRCVGFGAIAQNAGTALSLVDAVVVGTRSLADAELRGPWGRGLDVREGATLGATRVLVEDNAEAGVVALGQGSRATLEDVVIHEIRALPDRRFGHGVFAQEGASLAARGLVVSGSTTGGVVSSTGASVTLQDSVITDVRPSPLGGLGDGLDAWSGALTADRVLVRRVFNSAVTAASLDFEGAGLGRATLRDVVIEDVRANAAQIGRGFLAAGLGLQALRGGFVDARRVAMVDVTGFGVSAAPAGESPSPTTSRVALTEFFLRNVRDVPRGRPPFDRPYGFGVIAADGCSVELTRGVIDRGNWGLVLDDGAVRASEVVVARQAQGLGMSSARRELTRLSLADVLPRDNLLSETIYGARDAEITVPTDVFSCRTLDECRQR